MYMEDLAQDCGNSSALALELLQSYAKLLICSICCCIHEKMDSVIAVLNGSVCIIIICANQWN